MNAEKNQNSVSVNLPPAFVHGLLAISHLMDENVVVALHKAVAAVPNTRLERRQSPEPRPEPSIKRKAPVAHDTKLEVEILGQRFSGQSLSDLFGQCVDVIDGLYPEALERFAQKRTHARRYVARRKQEIHIKSPHLETTCTKSGWWISNNVSEQQVTAALQLLAEAAELEYGRDVIFPLLG